MIYYSHVLFKVVATNLRSIHQIVLKIQRKHGADSFLPGLVRRMSVPVPVDSYHDPPLTSNTKQVLFGIAG